MALPGRLGLFGRAQLPSGIYRGQRVSCRIVAHKRLPQCSIRQPAIRVKNVKFKFELTLDVMRGALDWSKHSGA